MSLVPVRFRDWWDDFDRPSRLLDQHFGLGLWRDDLWNSYQRPYYRPWLRSNSGTSSIVHETDKVQVILDVQQFLPSEVTVKTIDNTIIVEGKHDQKADEHGTISRHFVRRYLMPSDVEVSNITSSLSSDGVLTINAPKKSKQLEGEERSVPIIQTGVPAIKPPTQQPPSTATPQGPLETNIKIDQL